MEKPVGQKRSLSKHSFLMFSWGSPQLWIKFSLFKKNLNWRHFTMKCLCWFLLLRSTFDFKAGRIFLIDIRFFISICISCSGIYLDELFIWINSTAGNNNFRTHFDYALVNIYTQTVQKLHIFSPCYRRGRKFKMKRSTHMLSESISFLLPSPPLVSISPGFDHTSYRILYGVSHQNYSCSSLFCDTFTSGSIIANFIIHQISGYSLSRALTSPRNWPYPWLF